ncbi:MAG: tetratricopeptide repeat protein, partial [Deltaproteobacteria bacterium]|nr:tetratricopeptide repeat protein [Deltaproteobacteria bacterium]
GRGFIAERDALVRYEDYVYLYMIGEHELAAEGFFTLVTTEALGDVGLHRDAEWYLAESLFKMGNISTAEARYLVIADDDQHPFRDDAVRRLLELYATTGQSEEFAAFYEEEILNGRVRPSDLITYSLAKSFYFQGRYDEAVAHFRQIPPESPYLGKATYFLGTVHVVRGDLDAAIEPFTIAAEQTVDTLDDRQVHDLALLALARIYYEQGKLPEAAEIYGRVGGDSEYLAEKLYEVIWTFIKQEQYRPALDGVEIFLLRFPEHQYTAQLKLLDGHLRLEQNEFDTALDTYEKVVTDYTPIRERFRELARSDAEPRQYFQQILATAEGDPADSDGLPAYAVAMMVSDESLSRALGVYREIVHQEEQIEESEALIAELRAVLDSSVGIGGYERLRYDILFGQSLATESQLQLLEAEEQWLDNEGGAEVRRALEPYRAQRHELVERAKGVSFDVGAEEAFRARQQYLDNLGELQQMVEMLQAESEALRAALVEDTAGEGEPRLSPAEKEQARADLGTVETDLETLLAELETLRAAGPSTEWDVRLRTQEADVAITIGALRRSYETLRADVPSADDTYARIDLLHETLEGNQGRLGALRSKLTSMESSELGRIRARFEYEVEEVATQRVELEDTLGRAEEVSVALTRSGFGRLEDFFAESVLRADMGIVDVYWSQKVDVADQRARMAQERAGLLSDLEARFSLIRQKLGQ